MCSVIHIYISIYIEVCVHTRQCESEYIRAHVGASLQIYIERWGAGVETHFQEI